MTSQRQPTDVLVEICRTFGLDLELTESTFDYELPTLGESSSMITPVDEMAFASRVLDSVKNAGVSVRDGMGEVYIGDQGWDARVVRPPLRRCTK